jgi:pteridine reductase
MSTANSKTRSVAVITGGARRIGAAICRELHEAGYDIALHCRSSRTAADELATALCAERADSCHVFQADLSSQDGAKILGQEIIAHYNGVDLLVNNASGFSPTPLESCTTEQFDDMISSNLRGAYFLVQSLVPALKATQGSIVNITDMHLARPLPGFSAYQAAKAGLESLTRSLAVELSPDVRVNAVAPGAILWPEDDASYDDDARANTIARTPLGRLGEPTDIARTVKFLARDASFVTGQVVTVDGGQSIG